MKPIKHLSISYIVCSVLLHEQHFICFYFTQMIFLIASSSKPMNQKNYKYNMNINLLQDRIKNSAWILLQGCPFKKYLGTCMSGSYTVER